jgi:hypothetical protein
MILEYLNIWILEYLNTWNCQNHWVSFFCRLQVILGMQPEFILHEELSIVATVGVHSTPKCSFRQRHQTENRGPLCWLLRPQSLHAFGCRFIYLNKANEPMVWWKWSHPTPQALKSGAVTVAEVKVWDFLAFLVSKMGPSSYGYWMMTNR